MKNQPILIMKNSIFVLEDNEAIREIIEIILQTKGFAVKSFRNAAEFAEAMSLQEVPDLIIMDIMLPDGNGIEICQALKADELKHKIPVLLMSAHATAEAAATANAQGFIAKPFDINIFVDKVCAQVA